MSFKAPNSHRRSGSNILALLMGLALVAFAIASFATKRDLLDGIPAYWISASSALCFGIVLLIWVWSDWKEWIGNETVNMVVGVIVALIAIVTFAREIEKDHSHPSLEPSTKEAPRISK
jgi:uncharacterized membrane protein